MVRCAVRMNLATLLAWGSLCLVVSPANGLTINRHFLDYEQPPASAIGGGNIVDIFNAAADLWERAVRDDHAIDINFQYSPLVGQLAGTDNGVFQSSERLTYASIFFDNDGSTAWYLDPTPYQSDEYLTYSEGELLTGVGSVNVARRFSGATGLAAGRIDMFTLALHEIGHALGVTSVMTSFTVPQLAITAPRPYAGLNLPTTFTGGGHLTYSDAIMERNFGSGVRLFPSEVDILAVAEVNDYTRLNLNPQFVPEPNAIVIAGIAVGFFAVRRSARNYSRPLPFI